MHFESRHLVAIQSFVRSGVFAALIFGVAACSPQVKIHAPDKPIVINLNVKIEQEVRIKIEKDIDDLFRTNKDLF
jgi:hypothetical protein